MDNEDKAFKAFILDKSTIPQGKGGKFQYTLWITWIKSTYHLDNLDPDSVYNLPLQFC